MAFNVTDKEKCYSMCNSDDTARNPFTASLMSPHDLHDRCIGELNAMADRACNEIVLPELLNYRKMSSIKKGKGSLPTYTIQAMRMSEWMYFVKFVFG